MYKCVYIYKYQNSIHYSKIILYEICSQCWFFNLKQPLLSLNIHIQYIHMCIYISHVYIYIYIYMQICFLHQKKPNFYNKLLYLSDQVSALVTSAH